MADLLSIGLSGLRVGRNNITVTGHNISNIDTPGFSRQRAVQVTNPAFGAGYGYVGSGARTQTIERVVDSYVTHQVRVDTSSVKDHEAFLKNISEMDNLLSNESSALGTALNNFFNAVQSVSNDPLSAPARELLYSQGSSVSQRFKSAQSRLMDQSDNINTQMRTYVSSINELATSIGELNKQILKYSGAQNQPPNDLLDKREEVLRELSELVSVNVSEQDGYLLNVSIGNGVPLIVGESVSKLEVAAGEKDPGRHEIHLLDTRGARMQITGEIYGGELGGVLRYRSDMLDPALNEMGRIALVFAGEFNKQHQQGIDANGNQGGDFFTDINTENYQRSRVPGLQPMAPAGVWIDPEGLGKLPAQEFILKEAAGSFELKDAISGRTLRTAANMADLNDQIQNTYGFRISNGAGSDFNPAASAEITNVVSRGMLVSPVRLGASQLERSADLNTTDKLALGGISGGEHNATKTTLHYADLNGQSLSAFGAPPVDLVGATVSYDGTAYTLTGKDGTVLGSGTLAGDALTFTVGGADLELRLDGAAADGDNWVLEGGAGAANAKLLAALQSEQLVNTGGSTGGQTLAGNYAMLVEKVGIGTSESRTAMGVAQSVLAQTTAMREATSGVNMDEEAANLIRFQQAYMASVQVIAAAQKLFDTLLTSVGR